MSLSIDNKIYSEIIECIQRAVRGDPDVKIEKTGSDIQLDNLLYSLNELFLHVKKLNEFNGKANDEINSRTEKVQSKAFWAAETNVIIHHLANYIMDKANEAIYGLDSKGNIIYANEIALETLEYSREEFIGKRIYDIDPEIRKEDWENHWEDSKEKKFSLFESKHKTKNGKIIPVEVAIGFIFFEGKEYHSSFVRDITERKKSEETLLLTQYAFDSASIGIIRTGKQGKILGVNKHVCKNLGYTEEELLNMHVWEIDPGFSEETWKEHRGFLQKQESAVFETAHRRKDGSVFPVEINASYRVFNGNEFSFSFIKDLTERKKAEEELKSSLREKEVLLRELYHRTKNNMQVIRAMLAIKSAYTADEEVKKNYLDMENRILSMSLVHQKLYQSHNLSSLDLKEYIEELVQLLMKSHKAPGDKIKIDMHLESTAVLIDIAIPCGLILNELLANSLEHAFPDKKGRRNNHPAV